MEPVVAFPPAIPFTLQVTPALLPVTVATYCDDVPSVTVAAPVRVKVMGGGRAGRVTAELWATDGSATLVAVMVTFEDPGVFVGAV